MSTVQDRVQDLEARHAELLGRLEVHRANPDLGEALHELVETWRARIEGARTRFNQKIRVAFLAQVGRGKSTLISVATGLRLDGDGDPQEWSVLPVGDGGTTLGEVRVQVEDRADILLEVEPIPEDRLKVEVALLAEDVWDEVHNSSSGLATSRSLPGEELFHLLRTWCAPQPDAGRETLRSWAKEAADREALVATLLERLALPRRTKLLTKRFSADQAGLSALKTVLESLMAGSLPEAPAPLSSSIRLPRTLGEAPVDEIIDTQGLPPLATERTIEARPDLQRLFQNPDTGLVICSEFSFAPDPVSHALLQALTASIEGEPQPNRAIRLLIVDQRAHNESPQAKQKRTDRIEECKDNLRRGGLFGRIGPNDVLAVDARSEKKILDSMLNDMASQIREQKAEVWNVALTQAETALGPLTEPEHTARLRELDLRIRWAWEVELASRPSERADPLALLAGLIQAREPWIRHWSHLHAAIRRRGRYDYLDLIELGARRAAALSTDPAEAAHRQLERSAERYQLTPRNEAEAAHVALRLKQLSTNVAEYKRQLYQAWERRLNTHLKSDPANSLWLNSLLRWGQGPGYVLAIADLFREEAQKARLTLSPTVQPTLAAGALPPPVHLLRLQAVELQNFRCVESRTVSLSDVAVFVGDNGRGKTAWLEAIVSGLSLLLPGMEAGEAPPLRETDVRQVLRDLDGIPDAQQVRPVRVTLTGQLQGRKQRWSRGEPNSAEETEAGAAGVRRICAAIGGELRDGRSRPLPVLAYYGTQRLWPRDLAPEDRKVGNRQEGYRDCLSAASTHQQMLSWVRDFTLKGILEKRPVPQLLAIERAVTTCISGAESFYFDVAAKELRLKMNDGTILPFSQLSDGYRNIVAMVADIAWRASVLNPALGERAPDLAEGVVLIDEIDLHLHPRWQRHVLADLRSTFPRMQFIATTHSPFIIQSLQPGQLINLDEGARPDAVYADESPEDIAESIMGVDLPQRSWRRQEAAKVAEDYYRLLDQLPFADPARVSALKDRLDELLAPYHDNPAFSAFLLRKRLMAEARRP